LVSPDGINPGPVTLEITEEVAWLLRSKVRTGDLAIDGTTNVGVPLLLKLYDILSAFNSDISGLPPVGDEVEPAMTERERQFLKVLKEGANAGAKSNPNTGPDAYAGD